MDTRDVDPPLALADEDELVLRHVHAEPLAAELAALLDRLVHDRFTSLIVEFADEDSGRYVQFLVHDGDTLIAESVGVDYLELGRPLTDLDQLELLRIGWNLPDEERNHHANYWRVWSPPNVFDAAQLAALTLVRVHGLRDADEVVVSADRCPPRCRHAIAQE